MKIFNILFVPMGHLIRLAYAMTNNYLFAILLFALVIEIILSPIQIKQQKTQIKQAKLQPKANVIRKKYQGRTDTVSKQKMTQEIMELNRKEGYNAAAGCLPMLIQLPVVICLYQVIINPLRYISGLSAAAIDALATAINNAGGVIGAGQQKQISIINYLHEHGISSFTDIVPELEGAVLPVFKTGPFDLSVTPSMQSFNYLLLIPVFVFIAMYGSMKIMRRFSYQPPEAEEMQNSTSMKIMNFTAPLMSTWISFSVPAAVGIYWIFRNIISVIERFILSRMFPIPEITEEEMKAAEREYGGRAAKRERAVDKKPVRSLHRIDEEDDEPISPSISKAAVDEPTETEISMAGKQGTHVISPAPLKANPKKKKK